MTDDSPAVRLGRCEAGHHAACPCNGHSAEGRGGSIAAPAASPWVPPSKREPHPNVRLDAQAEGL